MPAGCQIREYQPTTYREYSWTHFFAGQKFRVVRFGLKTPVAGPTVLRFSDAEGVAMFLGGEPIDVTTMKFEANQI